VDRLVIHKGRRQMAAYRGQALLKVYRVAVGMGGAGPKRYAGDLRTPEGRYFIGGRHPSRRYHRFLLISYPNRKDRRRYRRLKRQGRIPPGRGIGSAVGIHGERRGFALLDHKLFDWTRGCVAVDDDEIEELYRSVVPRAAVIIHR
jgi:murein L,D-transpeptidase YafK